MADNIAITAGTGTNIATEDMSGVHHQKVKVEFGADNEATMVSASNPLPITPAATENQLGKVAGNTVTVSGELTRPADTNAYAAGDVVSDSTSTTTPVQISGCARVNQGSGYITGIRISTNKKSITPRLRVHLFNANNPTLAADNAAHKELYADLGKRIGMITLSNLSTASDTTNSDMSKATDFGIRIPFSCAASSTSLYYVLETLDTFTPDSGQKFTVVLNIEQN